MWSSGQPARLLLVDPSSNPAEVGNFSAKIVFEKDKFDRKEAGVGPICKNNEKSTLNDDPHA